MNKWNTVRLGDILDICHGKNQRDIERSDGLYPILGTGGIIGRTNSFLCDKPSVLIGRKGTIDRPQYMETPFWTIDTLFYTTISERAIPCFIFYVFCSINWQQYNAATGVPSLAASTIESIKILLPPLAEQRKIAEILRTWDEAIETAEAELKAKQERKRWLMDKLFGLGAAGLSKLGSSDWTVQRLGDILEIHHGKNQREFESAEGRYPILGTGGVIGHTNAFLYDKPSVLIGRKGTIDRPQYMDTPFWTIDTLFYTSISDRAIPRFIFYVFCTINWQQYNAATGVPSLAASTIESIKIQLPPLAEQRRIADILQAVDADAEVINCRIETLRAQKRGLMQKLLTGEVRVAA